MATLEFIFGTAAAVFMLLLIALMLVLTGALFDEALKHVTGSGLQDRYRKRKERKEAAERAWRQN